MRINLSRQMLSLDSRYLCINNEKPYYSSAVYASALHSVTLPFRMKPLGPTAELRYESGCLNVYETIQMLAGQSRQNKVSILDVAMPAPSLTGKAAGKLLFKNMQTLTPETTTNLEDLQATEVITLHGVRGSGGHHALVAKSMMLSKLLMSIQVQNSLMFQLLVVPFLYHCLSPRSSATLLGSMVSF